METLKKKLIIFMPSMEGGGVEKNTILITNYLANYINNIEFITFDNKFNKYFDKKVRIINHVANSKIKRSKYYKYLMCLILLVRSLTGNKKAYIFAFQANIYCIILSIILGKKLITRSNSSPSGWNKNIIKNFIFKILLKYPTRVIVNSKAFKREIDKKFNIDSKMIYNPLNKKEILAKSKEKLNDNFLKYKNSSKIINISRFTSQKDHVTLLKAFKLVNKKILSKLILIGYGSNKNKIIDFIKKNKLQNNVKIINFTFNPFKYMAKCDLFILTSIYEGLPNVILESMVLKKYVISSKCPTGPSEILKDGKYGGLFPVKNYKKLSALIIDYFKNKRKYKKKIMDAYSSLKRFDQENNCKLYLIEILKLMKT